MSGCVLCEVWGALSFDFEISKEAFEYNDKNAKLKTPHGVRRTVQLFILLYSNTS